jgi:hypothetical protein
MVVRSEFTLECIDGSLHGNVGGGLDEVLSDDEKVVEELRIRGYSIPNGVRKVHQEKNDYVEITKKTMLVENGTILGFIVFDFYDGDICDEVGDIVLSLCQTARWVLRSKKRKKGGLIFMFGARVCNGEFGRYSQSKKVGGRCLLGKEAPGHYELDSISRYVATKLYGTLRGEVSSFMDKLEVVVPHSVGTCASWVGHILFTTMGTSLNYFVQEYDDIKDTGNAVISWFEKDYQEGYERSIFRFRDFGMYFKPQQGTMTLFEASKVWHGTKRNDIRYSKFGVVLCVKKSVLEAGEKRMENIGFKPV